MATTPSPRGPQPTGGLLSRFAESVKFSKLVREQKKLIADLRKIRETLASSKTSNSVHRRRLEKDSDDAAKKLDDLGESFKKLGLEFVKSEDVVKEIELRAKLSEKEIDKELARQTREDLKSISLKKRRIAESYTDKSRQWEIFQLRYWGLTGRAIKWITGISGSALFVKGWKEFYESGVYAQDQQLQTVGKLNDSFGAWSGSAANFASVKGVLKGTLRAYGIKSADYEYLTRQYLSMEREHVETSEFFSKVGAIARISNGDVKDLWERTKRRSRAYIQSVGEVASETLDIVGVIDTTSEDVKRQGRLSGETSTTLDIFREDWMKSILDVTDEIERAGGYNNQVTVAKFFSKGVEAGAKLGTSFTDTLKLAKVYTKLLKLDEVYNFQLGLKVIADIDEAVEKRSRGLSALERDRVMEEVILNKFGPKMKVDALAWYKNARNGGYMTSAGSLGTLYSQTEEGMVEVASLNYDIIKHGFDVYGISLFEGMGASRAEAVAAVVSIKGSQGELLNGVEKKALLNKAFQKDTEKTIIEYRGMVTEGAKSVFGDAWKIMSSVWGNPLVKMAAGLGVLAYTFRKEIKGSVRLVMSFNAAASSILRWGGKEELSGGGGSLLSNAKGYFTKKRLKKGAMIGGSLLAAGALTSYGAGKYFGGPRGNEGEEEDRKKEAPQGMTGVPRTPFGEEIGKRIGESRPTPPGSIPKMVSGDIGPDSAQLDRISTRLRTSEAQSRQKILERAVVKEMGGRYVKEPGGKETVEVTIPGFVHSIIPQAG